MHIPSIGRSPPFGTEEGKTDLSRRDGDSSTRSVEAMYVVNSCSSAHINSDHKRSPHLHACDHKKGTKVSFLISSLLFTFADNAQICQRISSAHKQSCITYILETHIVRSD